MFDHEKLDVYRVNREFVAWVYARDAQPEPWRRFEGKGLLERIVSMLTKMTE